MEKIHLKILDVAKFVACIMIVMRHCQPFGIDTTADYFMKMITCVPVPFFFATSSFLFWYKGGGINHYITRLSVLYLVWFIIELPVVYFRFFHPVPDLISFFCGLFFHNTFYASWYIMASILGMSIVWVCSKKFNNMYLFMLGLLFFVLSLIYSTYHDLFLGTFIGDFIDKSGAYISYSNSFFSAVIYIVIGKILADNFEMYKDLPFRKDLALLLLFATFFILEYTLLDNYWQNSHACRLSLIPLTYFLVKLCVKSYRIQYPKQEFAKYFRISSILIYMMHPLLLRATSYLTHQNHNIIQFIIVVFAGCVITRFVQVYSNRIKMLKLLY